jgi:protein involved in temperature-dependent protein secretion
MLKFGQWCAETQHHRGQIPMGYWETIEDLAELTGNREQLLRTPAIWAGERTLFERQLKVHPLDWENRSLYVRMARDAGDWNTARRQTETLGGFPHPKIFPEKSDYDRIVAEAAKRGK